MKIKRFFKKLLTLAMGLPLISLFAGCEGYDAPMYGMPPNDGEYVVPDYGMPMPEYGMPPNWKSVSGFVYEDFNANGKFDSGEGISGIKYTLVSDNTQSHITDEIGDYQYGTGNDIYRVSFVFESTDSAPKKYKTRTIDFDFTESSYIDYDVAMEPEDNTSEN